MDLSITIASYNSCDITLRALESIFEKTEGIEFEVIVLDNASVDGSADMIEHRFPSVHLIRSDKNLGFAAAHNRALSVAQGKFLLVLNSDVLFLDNSAKKMVDRLQNGPEEFGVIGPQILNSDMSLAPSSRRRAFYSRTLVGLSAVNQYFSFGKLLPMRFLQRYLRYLLGRAHDNFDPPTSVQEVEWLDGMCVMFKHEALEQVGLFDEQFFFDYEIGDLLIRLRAKGWGIIFDPGVKVIHLGGYSRKKIPKIVVENKRSCLIYYAKHRPEYIPFMRRVFLAVVWLKLCLLRFWFFFSADRDSLGESIQILEETRRVFRDFKLTSVQENARIPRLPYAKC
jgi:hypothetical protein